MDVVITPDTSSVEGTTLVVEKIKEIIDDIVRKENSGLLTSLISNVVRGHPHMASDDFGSFLTYLPTQIR